MSGLTRPRGPLPARVYWRRRLVVLAVAVLLVAGLGQALGRGGDGQDTAGVQARTVGAEPTPSADGGTGATAASEKAAGDATAEAGTAKKTGKKAARDTGKKRAKKKQQQSTPPPLPQPDGPCQDRDVVVTPAIDTAVAGSNVQVRLLFTTRQAAACTFDVSPESVVVKVTSGTDRIWTSQQCPRAIPTATVVARQQVAGEVVVVWHGRRSNEDCSDTAQWALPGYYHAEAAALGSDPASVQFQLSAPTATATPSGRKSKRP